MANSFQYADIIVDQLGGRRSLTLMLGADRFMANPEKNNLTITFKAKGAKGANCLEVSLNRDDLYDVRIMKLSRYKCEVVAEESNLYADQLAPFFEEATGLSLSLPRIVMA